MINRILKPLVKTRRRQHPCNPLNPCNKLYFNSCNSCLKIRVLKKSKQSRHRVNKNRLLELHARCLVKFIYEING
jgi:hypothetical protein